MPLLARLSKFRSSFQFRLFYVFTLLTALLSFLLSTIFVVYEVREKRAYATSHLHQLAIQLADSARLPLYAENRDHLIQITEPLLRSTQIQAVVITSSNGKVLLDMRTPAYSGTDEKIVEVAEVYSNPLIPSVESALTGVADTEAAPKIGKIRLERGKSDLSQEIRLLVLYSTFAAIIFWMVVTAVCYLVLRQVTLSFNRLMYGLKLMKEGDYITRISAISGDEPGRAAIAINELADKLKYREEENRLLHMDLLKTNNSLEEEVAERIQAEQSIRESEQNLKLLLDVMPVGVVWAYRDGKLEYLNNFFIEHFGYIREEIRTADDWFSHAYPDPEYRDQIYGLQRNALKAARNDSSYTPMYEARVTCRNGEVRQVITKLNMTAKRTVAILIDITDREILQEQIIKAQKLESIGILAGGIAHNFNNALTGVLGFISLAAKQLDETHKATALLQHAEKATKKAAGMAKQLLTFSRGGSPFKKAVSIRNLVEESAALALNGTKVRTLIQIPDSTHTVMADEDQFRQAFSCITINAAQAMPNGGTLSICAENIKLTGNAALSAQQTDHVRLTFTDEGHGIPAGDLNKIFDPYYTTRPSNTGLGLASVHSIITKHGGQILVDSTVGLGTTVTLILQSTGQISGPGENANGPLLLPNRKIGSILVMDDEETVRDIARETVGFLGYQVTVCANGEEAIAIYKESHDSGSPFKAVILDLTIPGSMGGAEAAKQILSIDPDAKLIVSSGLTFDPVMTNHRDYGFCAAITKPYRADDLGSKLSLL